MKPSREERDDLARRIAKARRASPLTDAEISRLSRVHASQVARICRGEFRTISNNVVQICQAIGVPLQSVATQRTPDAGWARLETSVLRAWDRTPEGAERIARVIDAVAAFRTR